ncbi:MAG: hypothetical protein GEV13_10015 [Rhodospirillales bacterium]|nr:hypothetical protein [Rhodospirillales bacterium]
MPKLPIGKAGALRNVDFVRKTDGRRRAGGEKVGAALTIAAIVPMSEERRLKDLRCRDSQATTGDIMSSAATNDDVRQDDRERDALLNALSSKWKRFSRQELHLLKSSDDLVAQIVARYGVEQVDARRDVDALLDGRILSARKDSALAR